MLQIELAHLSWEKKMEPIITLSLKINWQRLGYWLLLRLAWYPIIVFEGLADDLGPDAQRFYAFAVAFVTTALLGIEFVLLEFWKTDHALLACAFSVIAYLILGMFAAIILRWSGIIERMLPRA